jgi:hypothetical protein
MGAMQRSREVDHANHRRLIFCSRYQLIRKFIAGRGPK